MQRSARFRVFRKIFRAGLRPPPEGSKLSNVAIAPPTSVQLANINLFNISLSRLALFNILLFNFSMDLIIIAIRF